MIFKLKIFCENFSERASEKNFHKRFLIAFLFLQVVQASEREFSLEMPVTGVSVTVFHCDAAAMANVVPNLDYGIHLFYHIVCV